MTQANPQTFISAQVGVDVLPDGSIVERFAEAKPPTSQVRPAYRVQRSTKHKHTVLFWELQESLVSVGSLLHTMAHRSALMSTVRLCGFLCLCQ